MRSTSLSRSLPLSVLLPALATLVACGGSVASEGASSSSGGSSGAASSSSGGSSSGSTSSSGGSTSSSGGSSGTLPLPQGAVDICVGNEYRPMNGILKGTANDYAELREVVTYQDPPTRTVDKDGIACKTASDPKGCIAALGAASDAGWNMASWGGGPEMKRYVVVTKGSEVKTGLDALWDNDFGLHTNEQAAFAATRTGQYRIVCDGQPNVVDTGTDSWLVRVQTGFACGPGTKEEEDIVRVTRDGGIAVTQTRVIKEGDPQCAVGRKPAGLVARAPETCADPLGRFFADVAHLEAASVFSFERLARELASLGAPPELVRAALESREDEIRHARSTAALARRFGADPKAPEVAPPGSRSLFAIALENAVEGCVRETYGALVAHWQAANASDAKIRKALAVIAEDETKHAELSLSVATFLDGLLTDAERDAVEAARQDAITTLAAELAVEPSPEVVRVAGLPSSRDALSLLAALDRSHLRAAA